VIKIVENAGFQSIYRHSYLPGPKKAGLLKAGSLKNHQIAGIL
jgi:hypothetical protein